MADFRSKKALGRWQEASKIRQEWLDHGLSTQPADRQAAERALTKIYARISRPRPRFEWVASPAQALPLVAGWPTLGQLFARIRDPHPRGKPPLASDLAMSVSRMRSALSAGVAHSDPELSRVGRGKRNEPWPELPPMAGARGRRSARGRASPGHPHRAGPQPGPGIPHPGPRRAACQPGRSAGVLVRAAGSAMGCLLRRSAPARTGPGTSLTTWTVSVTGPRWRARAAGGGPAKRSVSWSTGPNSPAPSRCQEHGTTRSDSGPMASATATAGTRC